MAVTGRYLIGSFIYCLLIISSISPTIGELHRAKQIKTKQGNGPNLLPRFPPAAFKDYDEEVKLKDSDPEIVESVWLGHSTETWIFSLISAGLVGLSGIFPLLVIPLETGKNLHKGAPAARLKLLLSFAVGGLLGDVFLHLLPEAWSHIHKVSDDVHKGHMNIGLWIMVGLFSFLVIEKIFPDGEDENEGEEDDEETEVNEQTEVICPAPVFTSPTTRSRAKLQNSTADCHANGQANGHVNGHTYGHANGKANSDLNGKVNGNANRHANGHANGHTNGHVNEHANGNANRHVQNGKVPASGNAEMVEEKESRIKTSGWLNLMANVIDNFTHGLAVAGSYCVSTKTGLITTMAVLLHEVPHEVGDFAILLQSGFDRWKAAKAQLITASGGLLGAICALYSESAEIAGDRTAWILPFTSGGFIYIALVTVVPELLKERNHWESFKQVVCLLTGIVMVAGVTILLD